MQPKPNILFRYVIIVAALCIFSYSAHGQSAPAHPADDWPIMAARLSAAITGGTNEQKRDALFAIRNYATESASRLAIPALADRDEIVRATAASAVIYLPRNEAVPVLTRLLSDRQPFVRKEAAYALGKVGGASISAPLIAVLQRDRDREVKAAAALALGSSSSFSAVQALTGVLNSRVREDDEFIRRSAARSIGEIALQFRGVSIVDITTPHSFLHESYKPQLPVNEPNITSGFTSSVPVLIRVLQNRSESDDTRREAAFALGAIGNELALAVVTGCQASPDPYLAQICLEATAMHRDPKPQS